MPKIISDNLLANYIVGCPSYDPIKGKQGKYEFMNNILRPIFNDFQLHKMNNDLKYHLSDMKAHLHSFTKEKENKYYDITFLESCVQNYYKLFKGKFYKRYKVLSFTTPYTTEFLDQDMAVNGEVDLIIKTSYGVTLINYFYFTNFLTGYAHNLVATRLQMAGRFMKLIAGIEPKLLCAILFRKKSILKYYFKYLDQPYENYLTLISNDLLPIKRSYAEVCANCKETSCTPWKHRDETLI